MGATYSSVSYDSLTTPISASLNTVTATAQAMNDVGITVPGSKSTQSFTTTTMGVMEPEKHSIVLKLLGETPDNEPVRQAVTVKHKPKCTTCGKQNKATSKFCSECGTSLELFA
jgi:membrane protease subunit (stomatin/prohibitin family)